MRFLSRLALLFYVALLSIVGGVIILFVAHVVSLSELVNILQLVYEETQLRMIVGVSALGVIFLSFMFARTISGYRSKERTIAFDNPSGRVSVSLNAMEDMVRRVILKLPEVKDVRADILAIKKGLQVECRLVLRADVNIPEITAQLQEMVKNKIQDTIGIEETVIVKIHVGKMIVDESRLKRQQKKEDIEDKPMTSLPFQGYRP